MLDTILIIAVTAAVTLALSILKRNLVTPERKLDYRLHELALADPTFERCMAHLLGPPLVDGNRITSLLNGDEIFPAMLAAIRSAKVTITFETYIYWSGKVGREFADALAERAKAGVRVHVLLDWIGSNKLDAAALAELQEAGVLQVFDTQSQIDVVAGAPSYGGMVLLRLFSNWGPLPNGDVDFDVQAINPSQRASFYLVSTFLRGTLNADTDALSIRWETTPGVWSDWVSPTRSALRSFCQENFQSLFTKEHGWAL